MGEVQTAGTIDDLLRLVPDQPDQPDGRRLLIGIAGAPGAGKTSVAEALVAALGERAVHVPMDGYHLSDAVLTAQGTLDRKGAPETFDSYGYAALLDRIRADREHAIYAPGFARDLEQPIAGSFSIEPEHEVVVSEGNYLLLPQPEWAAVRGRFDTIWFLTVDPAVRHRRLVARHVEFGKEPAFAESWVNRVDEPNARQVEATAVNADTVVDVTGLRLPGH